MKKILQSVLAFGLLCGSAGAIGIEWGVDALDFGTEATPQLADSSSYGSGLGNFVLQLVFVGNGNTTLGGDGISRYDTFTVVDTGTLATVPVDVPGVVSGSAQVSETGTYVMLLYNNYGGYYSLSTSSSSQVDPTPLSFEVTGDMEPTGFYEFQITSGSVYQGAVVPEPGTAALALAGIALLFRRRRQ